MLPLQVLISSSIQFRPIEEYKDGIKTPTKQALPTETSTFVNADATL